MYRRPYCCCRGSIFENNSSGDLGWAKFACTRHFAYNVNTRPDLTGGLQKRLFLGCAMLLQKTTPEMGIGAIKQDAVYPRLVVDIKLLAAPESNSAHVGPQQRIHTRAPRLEQARPAEARQARANGQGDGQRPTTDGAHLLARAQPVVELARCALIQGYSVRINILAFQIHNELRKAADY
jgi:hypothetical protein